MESYLVFISTRLIFRTTIMLLFVLFLFVPLGGDGEQSALQIHKGVMFML